MHRRHLQDLLGRYLRHHPGERATVEEIRDFVCAHEGCFERTCTPGHVTGSAWVVSADRRFVLLTHHAVLGRWLQLGGHADGEADPFRVALREAREESGLGRLIEPSGEPDPLPLDVDVHRIPARRAEPAHLHFDIRYLLVAPSGQPLVCTEESHEIRWVPVGGIEALSGEESLLRMARKASAPLPGDPTGGRPV